MYSIPRYCSIIIRIRTLSVFINILGLVESGYAEQEITVWGLPVAGEDFTDIPVEIQVSVKSLPQRLKILRC